jgi:hypothetical protein
MRRIRGAGGICVACVAGMLMVAAPAGAATATERVSDGGFDQTLCNSAGCLGGPWTQAGSTNGGVTPRLIGPICSAANTDCSAMGNSGYTSQFHWARIGAATESPESDLASVDSYVQQDIQVPASFPPAPLATLHFALRIRPGNDHPDETLTVSLGGTPVFSVDDTDNTYTGNYQPVEVPLDALVGPGAKTLRFEASGMFRNISSSFDIDDVSVTAADALALAPPAAAAPTGPAGQRAAALAKCKKKHGKKRKKCKQRANLLPV